MGITTMLQAAAPAELSRCFVYDISGYDERFHDVLAEGLQRPRFTFPAEDEEVVEEEKVVVDEGKVQAAAEGGAAAAAAAGAKTEAEAGAAAVDASEATETTTAAAAPAPAPAPSASAANPTTPLSHYIPCLLPTEKDLDGMCMGAHTGSRLHPPQSADGQPEDPSTEGLVWCMEARGTYTLEGWLPEDEWDLEEEEEECSEKKERVPPPPPAAAAAESGEGEGESCEKKNKNKKRPPPPTKTEHGSLQAAALAVREAQYAKYCQGFFWVEDDEDEIKERESCGLPSPRECSQLLRAAAAARARRAAAPAVDTLARAAARGMWLSLDRAGEAVSYVAGLAVQAKTGSTALLLRERETREQALARGRSYPRPAVTTMLMHNLFPDACCDGTNVCYGPVRLVWPLHVVHAHRLLQQIGLEDVAQCFQPASADWPVVLGGMDFSRSKGAGNGDGEGESEEERAARQKRLAEDRDYVLHHFAAMKAFVAHCAEHGFGLFVHHW